MKKIRDLLNDPTFSVVAVLLFVVLSLAAAWATVFWTLN